MPTLTMNGRFSLHELTNTISERENLGFLRLTKIEAELGTQPINIATFEDNPSPDPLPTLFLVAIGSDDELERVAKDQEAQNRTLLFDSVVWVSGARQRMAAFR